MINCNENKNDNEKQIISLIDLDVCIVSLCNPIALCNSLFKIFVALSNPKPIVIFNPALSYFVIFKTIALCNPSLSHFLMFYKGVYQKSS